jgi:sugar phosphate isomerase/epimerase
MTRVDEVRLADCRGDYEEHLNPGEGTMDFADMFRRIEADGFNGHYTNQFGELEDMLRGRDYLVKEARKAGLS